MVSQRNSLLSERIEGNNVRAAPADDVDLVLLRPARSGCRVPGGSVALCETPQRRARLPHSLRGLRRLLLGRHGLPFCFLLTFFAIFLLSLILSKL